VPFGGLSSFPFLPSSFPDFRFFLHSRVIDPQWYQDWSSPYFNDSHRKVRSAIRKYTSPFFPIPSTLSRTHPSYAPQRLTSRLTLTSGTRLRPSRLKSTEGSLRTDTSLLLLLDQLVGLPSTLRVSLFRAESIQRSGTLSTVRPSADFAFPPDLPFSPG
jgi:hypothetical protein